MLFLDKLNAELLSWVLVTHSSNKCLVVTWHSLRQTYYLKRCEKHHYHRYIFDNRHLCYGKLTAVKTRYSLTIITWMYRALRLRAHRGLSKELHHFMAAKLKVNFFVLFRVSLLVSHFVKTLKRQVKLIINCPRARAITYRNKRVAPLP